MKAMLARFGRRSMLGPTRPVLAATLLAVAVSLLGLGTLLATARQETPTPTTPCPAATPTATETALTPTAGDLCVEIGEFDLYFQPNVVGLPADTAVRVVLPNKGAILHNFSVTDHENSGVKNLNISVDIKSGETMATTINAPEGSYYFFCNQPGHEQAGMRGYLEVKKDGGLTIMEATVTPKAG